MSGGNNKHLAAALAYGKRGWRVFPILRVSPTGGCECAEGVNCDRPGKHPALKGWPREATCDPDLIREWWTASPERGIGIATGEGSGLTVLDVDGMEGVEALAALAGSEGIPPTPTVQSRPGRYHYYFRYNPEIKSQAGKLGDHLDTRSDGGYVVAPPSRHSSGGVYSWLQAPDKIEVAPWPEFLRGGAKKGKEKGKAGRPLKEQFNPSNPNELRRLEEALGYIDPDDEEKWSQIGWILGRAFLQSDAGFARYSAWAARSKKYDAKRTKGHYYERSKEVRGNEIKTTGSLFKWAAEAGWMEVDPESREHRDFHVHENPFNEQVMLDEMSAAAAAAPRVFVMDKRLVKIVRYGLTGEVPGEDVKRDPTSFVVWEYEADTLAVELTKIAAFWTRREGREVRTGFPRPRVATFINCREYTGVKPLLAFVAHPTLRADGSMIDEEGYDARSRLFLTGRVEGLKVSAKLGQKEARRAMTDVLAPFSEYPWASEVDRAVFCAALMTVGLRHLFDVAPLFAFSSPKHGSGKTQLAECISRLWYGTTLSKATWTPAPDEMEKRIAAFLLAGDRMVCLDNVTEGQRLEDSTLNKVLTSRRNTFRILGRTERVELTNEATWFATGNQLLLAGDIARRALLCYIDAKVVDPAARSFRIENLPVYVMENRARMMSGALSVAASWIAAGRPMTVPAPRAYGSFGEWYGMIRPMLMWAGEADIARALDAVQEEDTEADALSAWANALRRALPPDGKRVTMAEVMKLMSSTAEMRPAFSGCVENAEPNYRTMAALMRRCENKIFLSDNPGEPFRITRRRNTQLNIWTWGVEYVSGA